MIEIRYCPGRYRVTLRGHAGAGVPGQDLICCAASILTYTWAANVRRMHRLGWLQSAAIAMDPGDADISCVPRRDYRDRVRTRLDALSLGFALLHRDYPDFVRFQMDEKEETHEHEQSN